MADLRDWAVAEAMREVAAQVIMPRFQRLAEHEIDEKEPGDLVTVVDKQSEARLTRALMAIEPGSRVVGEEAVAANPALLGTIGDGLVWIVDPLDGTANYAAGDTPFAVMVALARDGVVEAGWILDPVSPRMLHAVKGEGAFVDGVRIRSRGTGLPMPVAALATRFLPLGVREQFETRSLGHLAPVPIPGCAGEQYPRVGLGLNDVALFWRSLPWDHAPGALWLEEAGGKVARLDGRPYRVTETGEGLLAAATPELWDRAAAILVG
ncbi:inositol monophosphatase [Sphingomonas naphthae]|uniref:Inositol monophosphatase n=1 Tax=Sphingomonas naphthae TaxID=1813468 RepID=A0ABY7TPW6_9SPHN|nr:inositol monophosphatase family protein [Sphingomonas naphthae]WCT75163.1 inositol monophosphatase [Sphingomonas naphthae]